MAPHLAQWRHDQMKQKIDRRYGDVAIRKAVGCSRNAAGHIRNNLRDYGCVTAPRKRSGQQRSLTPTVREALVQ